VKQQNEIERKRRLRFPQPGAEAGVLYCLQK